MKVDKILSATFYECIGILDSLQIPYAPIGNVTVNYRARRRWGQCRFYPYTGLADININSWICDGEHEIALKTTMLHELLHSVEGCQNHGQKWKAYAQKVNAATGLNVSRGMTYEEAGVDPPAARYTVVCVGCGSINRFERSNKIVRNLGAYRCSKCKGDLRLIERREVKK